ncbi:MAG TPA: TetR/AcrR family transcriptional regulator [Dongiaceae bacterium]|nr:TetR/AcrR family transcriptional regulator [Dongiaceae bacterium]
MAEKSLLQHVVIEEPAQQRSKDALDRFLKAAEQALVNNQFEETGVTELAQMADSSVGTFYRLIGDKNLLLMEVHQRFIGRVKSLTDATLDPERWNGIGLEPIVSTYVSVVMDSHRQSEGLLRALIRRSSADPFFRERFHAMNNYIGGKFVALVLQRSDEINHPKPAKAAELASQVLLGAMNHNTLAGLGSLSGAALKRELTLMVCRYLGMSDQ